MSGVPAPEESRPVRKLGSWGLRGLAVVELEHATEPLTALDRACSRHRYLRRDALVAQTLVWPFLVIMVHKRPDGGPEMRFAEWHDAVQALGLD